MPNIVKLKNGVVFKGDTNPALTANGLCNVYAYRFDDSVIKVKTRTAAGNEALDGNLKAFPIEIRIYL